MNPAQNLVERLESRIALASASVIYTDIDGDLVRITATVPGTTVPPLDLGDLVFTDGNPDGQLAKLTVTDFGFNDAKVVFSVTKKAGGDGLAHVGFIDATGRDLDRVVVKGDLGRILAGDATTENDPGLNLLQARTMGMHGLTTQSGGGNLESNILGRLGAVKIAGDVADANLGGGTIGVVEIGGDLIGNAGDASGRIAGAVIAKVIINGSVIGGAGAASGEIFAVNALEDVRIGGDLIGGAGLFSGHIVSFAMMGKVTIGGSIIGGSNQDSGYIFSFGDMAGVKVGRDLRGSTGVASGAINCNGVLGTVVIGGDVIGDAGERSGRVFGKLGTGSVTVVGSVVGGAGLNSGQLDNSGDTGPVKIGGDMIGAAGQGSGQLRSVGNLTSLRIGGDLTGGTGTFTGLISCDGTIGSVRIGGDLVGGSVAGSGSASHTGEIISLGRIGSVTIGGSLVAGTNSGTGALSLSGAIVAGDDLGPVKIARSIIGNTTNPVVIIARGQDAPPAAGFDIAIGSLTVGGDVRYARILAGFDAMQTPNNADASIGAVKVGRDWFASSIVAGAQDSGADGFGRNDSVQPGGLAPLLARIASITIKGDLSGSITAGDHFGFVAQQIEKLKIGPRVFVLASGPANDNLLIPFAEDVRLLEV